MRDAPVDFHTLKTSPAALIEAASGEIARRFAGRLPNLSSLTVLLPSMQAAAGFKAALRLASRREVLLLPRFATLATLGETISLARTVAPPSLRLAQLYSALKARSWFDPAELWTLSAELADLFDELIRARSQLPATVEEFARWLEEAYAAKPDAAMHFEARLAHEMWYAFHRADIDSAAFIDVAAARQLRLAALAAAPPGPLCAVGLPQLSAVERAFLHRYAEHETVLVVEADEQGATDELSACFARAWTSADARSRDDASPDDAGDDIKRRAETFRAIHPQSPLQDHVALHAAASLEDEALAAAGTIRRWVGEGRRSIALVAADRLTARRVRALLERDGILLADESGWTLSTTSASTVIMRLLETISDGFYHRDVLDLAKSPFFATDWAAERKKRAVHRLEGWVREHNLAAGLDRFRALVARQASADDEAEIVRRLDAARGRLQSGRQTLAAWIDRLHEALASLGALPGLAADAAGRQLMELLALRRRELAGHDERMSPAEWRCWLNAELEDATFRDDTIDSPVVLTTLSATRLRRFEAAVLVGADGRHLTARPAVRRLFNQSVRRELGLPGATEAAAQLQSDLIGLLARSDRVLITWQGSKEGEHNAASPWIIRLAAFHAIAYGDDLQRLGAAFRQVPPRVVSGTRLAPAPAVPRALMPAQISTSAYGSLLACPYQFFARHVLRLNERGEVSEEMEKRDYGELVHAILAHFHRTCPQVSAVSADRAESALRNATDEVFHERLENNYAALAWKMRWERMIPAYLAWQQRWEADGWCFDGAEKKFECAVPLTDGTMVQLHGRVDRVDRRHDGALAVLDYKTQKKSVLANKLAAPGEDVQLPVYALLVGNAVSHAAYVSLDDRVVATVPLAEPLPSLPQDVCKRLVDLLDGMTDGQGLPAQGAPAACSRCEMRGLCRLDYWDDSEDSR